MNIQGLSSPINTFSNGGLQSQRGLGTSSPQSLQGRTPGQGFSTNDVFEGASKQKGPGVEGVLRNSLHHAGVDQARSKAVMDAVRGGASLDSALQSAGVTPQQHQSVMDSVRAQDRR